MTGTFDLYTWGLADCPLPIEPPLASSALDMLVIVPGDVPVDSNLRIV